VSCRGAILVGGGTLGESAIKQAVQMQVRAVIVGSFRSNMAAGLMDLPFPVVATEGFGVLAMSDPVFNLLRSNEGRAVRVDARTPGGPDGGRPDLIIPLPVASLPPQVPLHGSPVKVGSRVRALRAPYMGAVGEVKTLYDRARPLPTGAHLPGAEVEIDDPEWSSCRMPIWS
jgi:hypothetical protein